MGWQCENWGSPSLLAMAGVMHIIRKCTRHKEMRPILQHTVSYQNGVGLSFGHKFLRCINHDHRL